MYFSGHIFLIGKIWKHFNLCVQHCDAFVETAAVVQSAVGAADYNAIGHSCRQESCFYQCDLHSCLTNGKTGSNPKSVHKLHCFSLL